MIDRGLHGRLGRSSSSTTLLPRLGLRLGGRAARRGRAAARSRPVAVSSRSQLGLDLGRRRPHRPRPARSAAPSAGRCRWPGRRARCCRRAAPRSVRRVAPASARSRRTRVTSCSWASLPGSAAAASSRSRRRRRLATAARGARARRRASTRSPQLRAAASAARVESVSPRRCCRAPGRRSRAPGISASRVMSQAAPQHQRAGQRVGEVAPGARPRWPASARRGGSWRRPGRRR